MARLKWYLDPLSPHHLKKEDKNSNNNEKNVVKVGPPLTKLSGSMHGEASAQSDLRLCFFLHTLILLVLSYLGSNEVSALSGSALFPVKKYISRIEIQ